MENSSGHRIFLYSAIAKLVLVTVLILFITTVSRHPISTPIEELEMGRVYEVEAIVWELAECYLLLRADGKIGFYRIPSADIPQDVRPGEKIVKLSSGIRKIPS